ncbi:unnamed protein product [Meloidogyne enterolobii]|uniref:Uncharacterized protein n=1 Tax=Meloidogyne enterolobii TaxID=390850 RepID=A0ACB1AT86_MELEN
MYPQTQFYLFIFLINFRNKKISGCNYFLMILITLTLDILFQLSQYFFIMPYIGGGIEPVNEINDYWNFILVGYNATVNFFANFVNRDSEAKHHLPYNIPSREKSVEISQIEFIFILLYYALPYLIVLICAIKMIRYVNAHTGYDNNMKKMLKQLTFTLILLV